MTELAAGIGYAAELVDFSEFNAKHRQTVALGNLAATPPAMLGPTLEPCTVLPFRTRLMERLREFPPVAAACRFLYDGVRPNRIRLAERSFSIAAVLSPNRSGTGDRVPERAELAAPVSSSQPRIREVVAPLALLRAGARPSSSSRSSSWPEDSARRTSERSPWRS